MKIQENLSFAVILIIGSVIAVPVNDLCSGALPITGTTIGGTTLGANADYQPIGCGTGYTGADVVYYLDVVTAGTVTLTVNPSGGWWVVIYLRSVCDDDFNCITISDYTIPGDHAVINQYLSPGRYYLIVDGFGESGNFSLDYSGPPLSISESVPRDNYLSIFTTPNPFNSSVTIFIDYGSESAEPSSMVASSACRGVGATGRSQGQVGLKIFDINGHLVADLPFSRTESQGNYGISENRGRDSVRQPTPLIWRPDDSISSGIYFVFVSTGGRTVAKKIVLLR